MSLSDVFTCVWRVEELLITEWTSVWLFEGMSCSNVILEAWRVLKLTIAVFALVSLLIVVYLKWNVMTRIESAVI